MANATVVATGCRRVHFQLRRSGPARLAVHAGSRLHGQESNSCNAERLSERWPRPCEPAGITHASCFQIARYRVNYSLVARCYTSKVVQLGYLS